MADRRYKAFISYSHEDKEVASWLHRELETYRFPKGLADGETPERLHPIFKDRDELPAADSLGEAIERAIGASDALIVLCSPSAAKSPWIAKEVDAYKRLHGDRNVFPVIVEGEPPDNFPAPLLVHYENGVATGRPAEPIAADIRPEADGRKLGKLKLAAGLAGVELDHLVQRDAARRQRRLVMVAAASFIGMVGTSALAAYAIDQRNEAREQRAEADGLIEYMLTDLRKQLEPVGRLEVLDGVGRRAMAYYTRQKLEDLSASELGRRVRAVQLVAEVQNLRGDNEAALPAFEQAARTTEELLARKPDDPERMFNHGQSLFWVGYVAWQHGKMDEARAAMEAYADISTRLAAMDPDNLEWQMEEAYSLSNLGTMDVEDGKLTSALDYFRKSVAGTRRVSLAEGKPAARQIELAEGLSWIASTSRQLGKIPEALEVRREELEILDEVLARDPGNNDARQARLYSVADQGRMMMLRGQRETARQALDNAIAEAEDLIAADPDNTLFFELVRGALRDRALLAWSGRRDELASARFDRLEELTLELQRRDPNNYEWAVVGPAGLALQRALTDRSDTPSSGLRQVASRAREQLSRTDPDNEWMFVAASFLDGVASERDGNRTAARAAYRKAMNAPSATGERVDLFALALRAAAAERAGENETAAQLTKRMKELGVDPIIDDRLP